LADGVAIGNRLLQCYGVLENPAWQRSVLVQALSDGERRQLGDAMGELLLLQARALILQHGDGPNDRLLQRALVMNERAAGCSAAAAASPALWQQRGRLHA